MAHIIKDRVKETTTTTGTGSLTLAGAMTGFRAFSAVCGTGDTLYYALQAVDGSGAPTGDWEVGLGTYSAANTLTRTTILSSSNSGAVVSLSSGTKQVWLDIPAAKYPTGGASGLAWANYLCAALEPDAIESLKVDSFSYSISSSVTKLLMASWQTRLSSSGRMEQRNPSKYVPLRGVTLAGTGTGSTAVILDPTAPTYIDPWETYYARMGAINEYQTRYIPLVGSGVKAPFLPGAYGAIVTQATCFDNAWILLRVHGTYGINLWDEISDTAAQRFGDSLSFPVSLRIAGTVEGNTISGSPTGSVSFVLLPSSWSAIADSIASSYIFRDDFMGSSVLDTGVWTRTQSTTGNVEIDTTYQWCKVFGNSTWGTNGLRETTGHARSGSPRLVVNCYVPLDAATAGAYMVGWGDGAGINYTNLAHAINFAASGVINVYENGTARGTVGSGYTAGSVYRIRITANTGGSATYEIQGGKEYPAIGGATWTTITPGTTSSATSTLYATATAYAGSGYVGDFRVY